LHHHHVVEARGPSQFHAEFLRLLKKVLSLATMGMVLLTLGVCMGVRIGMGVRRGRPPEASHAVCFGRALVFAEKAEVVRPLAEGVMLAGVVAHLGRYSGDGSDEKVVVLCR